MPDYELVVIGAGTGGLTVAKLTAAAGKRVLLIERGEPGGDCLWTGCVPTKAIIECARRLHEARHSSAFGVIDNGVTFDFQAVRRHVASSQAQAGRVDSAVTIAAHGIELRQGCASFVDPFTVEVSGSRVTGEAIVIATGGEPALPPIPGLRESDPDTNVQLVSWETLPRSLAIIGGGPIGIEFAQALTRLGVSVTVIEAAERILEREEASASALITGILEREGVVVRRGMKVSRVESDGQLKSLSMVSGGGNESTVEAERILVATGRNPELGDLALDRAGVLFTARGITVDQALRTSQPHIFAVGDVNGGYQFTHVAEAQGRLVANILKAGRLGRRFQKWSDRVVPRVTYTDPEVASVGLNEEQARHTHRNVRTWEVPLTEVDRAIVTGRTEGHVKIITARGWQRWFPGLASLAGDEIVGASIVGPHAGDLLMPIVNAMRMRLPIGMVAWNMQAYPTLALGVRQAAGLPFS
jgi:pyruvate/2-oxoglutarate dehydrogenase complex dihydrolipoamide dehydrogenase (E3) component